MVVICILAPKFFSILFGPNWEVAGRYVQILGLMYGVRFAVVPLSHTLNLMEKQNFQFFWDGTRLIIVVTALLVGKMFGMMHYQAILIYGLLMTTAYIFLWFLSWHALKKLNPEKE